MRATRTLTLALLACLLTLGTGPARADGPVKIGVLAKNGAAKAVSAWKATADYLTAKIPGKTFQIEPLGFDKVYEAVQTEQVSFFIVNSSMFVTTQVKYGATPIATMVNSRQGKALEAFGGVVFTASDRDDINSLADLKEKSFMAVDPTSFGGWQMALKEFVDAGLDPAGDLAKLEFGGKHENVVLAVVNGAADAGTVRTDTLERMAADGSVSMEDIKVIGKKSHADFPFVCSTALYPEWPIAKTKGTPDALANSVADALRQMKPDDAAAKAAKVVGWTAPLDYEPVRKLQETLKVDAYARN